MSKSKKKYIPKFFESTLEKGDTSSSIFVSMRLSDAWKSLSSVARLVYIDMKMEYYRQKKKPSEERQDTFYFNKFIWNNIYGYKNANQIKKYIDELIEKGFIEYVKQGWNTRTKSIYKYSDKWKNYAGEAPP